MHDYLKRLSLPTKLLLIAAIPMIFIGFLTARLYAEKSKNIDFIKTYLDRIHQSASVTRLIDELQKERFYSFEYALDQSDSDSMLIQRKLTDSAIHLLEEDHDFTLNGFVSYTFLQSIDSVRKKIDQKKYAADNVIQFFSSSIFRLNTLNRPPSIVYQPLKAVYSEIHLQRLLSEMITYQGIINANVYTVLFRRKYELETLMGTRGAYDVYKSYERELELKSPELALPYSDSLKRMPALQQVDAYLSRIFTNFRFDSTYHYHEWKELSWRSLNELRTLQMNLLNGVEKRIQEYYSKEQLAKTRALIYLLVVCALLTFMIVFILSSINKSLKELKLSAVRMANGETDLPLQSFSDDAIGSLASSIKKVDEKNKELAEAAQEIGKGNFSVEVEPRGPGDKLGNALVQMKQNLLASRTDLERSREEFRKLADFVPQIVWTARPDGTVDYYNKKWYEITGTRETTGEQSWVGILHPEDVGPSLTAWYRSVEKGIPYEAEYRFRDVRTDSYRWFLGRALPVRDENGTIIKWFGTGTDIHDQKIQKERLEELVAQRTLDLKRSNEDLQQFAHVASHDLKEPVRKIRTFSQRLAEEYGAMVPEKGRTFIDKIQASSERMAHMIDSILSYSVVTATEMEEEAINLNILLEGITSDLELLILQKEASINIEKLPGIKGIPTLIYQLFYNLINNALKFSKTDTPAVIQIYGRKLPAEEIASFDLRKSGSYVEIIVKDNGIGFSQEYADKVFNVFTRLNSRDKYEGTGLGLALCRKIVHRHGGVIRAKSAEGEGAEFHIILPAGF